MNRILCMLAAGALLAGCASTSTNSSSSGSSPKASAKARAAQLREGMTRGQVERLLGSPNEVDHDDGGYHHGRGYIPYYGWHRGGGYSEEELKWEYKNIDVEVKFRRNRNGEWVVKEWDR